MSFRSVDVAELKDASGLRLAAPAFDVSFEGGLQPDEKVAASLDLSKAPTPRGETLVFVTKHSDTGKWEGIRPTVKGDLATVQMSHFSVGMWGWADDLMKSLTNNATSYFKLRFDAPKCAGKEPRIGDSRYSVKVKGSGLHACVVARQGEPRLTLHSNSPFVWRVKVPQGGTAFEPSPPPLDIAQMLTVLVYLQAQSLSPDNETIVVPGGSAQVGVDELPSGTLKVKADVDPLLGFIAVAWEVVGGKAAKTFKVVQRAEVAECVASVIDSSQFDIDHDSGKLLNTVVTCLGKVVTGGAQLVLAVVSSIATQVATQIMTVAGHFQRTNHLTATVAATTADQQVGDAPRKRPQPGPGSTSGNGTIVTVINPFNSTGLQDGWQLDRDNPSGTRVSCYGTSYNAMGPGTLTCGITADGANACWRGDSPEPEVWCLDTFDVESKTLRVLPAEDLPERTTAPEEPEPLFLQLEDGSIWFDRFGGAWGGRSDGLVGIAGCANDVGICDGMSKKLLAGDAPGIDLSGKYWKVKVGELGDPRVDYPEPISMTVSRVWFMAGRQ